MATGTAIPTVPISTYLTQLGGSPSGGDSEENPASIADALTSQAGFLKADPNASINIQGASQSQLSDAKSALLAGYTPQQVASAVFSSNPIASASDKSPSPTGETNAAQGKDDIKPSKLDKSEKALQSIAGPDYKDPTKETKLFGVIPTGGTSPTFPESDNAEVSKLAKALGIDNPNNAFDFDQKDWDKIRKAAQSGLDTDEEDDQSAKTGEGKDTTLSQLATTLADQYAAQGIEQIGSEGAQLADENQAIMGQIMPSLTGSVAGGDSTPAVTAAMDAYAKAYGTSEAFNSEAYTQSGIANEQYLATSPEAAYLQMLSQPGSEYYKDISPDLLKSLPESLQYALQQAELGGDYASGGIIATPKGGWPASVTGGTGSSTATTDIGNALAGLGTVPGSPTSPSSLSTNDTSGGGSNPAG